MTRLRLAFMGTPDFAVPSLDALVAAGHDVACVYSQPPRPAGRGKQPRPSPVALAAERHGIEVRTPASLKDEAEQQAFAALGLDAAIVAAYGLILPKAILEAPRLGCINVHASLLPRWRGAAPIQRSILAGDTMTGISIMQMDEGLDTGAAFSTHEIPLSANETAGSLHDKLAALGAEALVDTLDGITSGALTAAPQPEDGITYAKKIEKSESEIDWALSATEIERLVRAMAPWPGAWTTMNGERVKILEGKVIDGAGNPGEVLDDEATIACAAQAYRPLQLQRGGKSVVATEDFLRGFSLGLGTKIGSSGE